MIRDATPADLGQVLELNLESERFLSPLDEAGLHALHGAGSYHRVVVEGQTICAFLLAFREGASYESPNYRWFAERYPNFLYIDRVAVGSAWRKRGFGVDLYEDLIDFARGTRASVITCEYYTVPENGASRRFHERFGFEEVGSQWVADGTKCVSLQIRKT